MVFQLNFNTASSVLVLVSLVFLVLATVTAPVSQFGLGVTSDFKYGIFGYCDGSSCPSASYPYSVGSLEKDGNWILSETTRNTLSKIFIICPIAAGFNLICLIMIIVSHFLSFKSLMVSIALNILSFVLTTIIAIIVVLVFYPNVAWTGWILIGAAAANLISLVFLFLTLRFKDSDSEEDDYEEGTDLTAFDDNFKSEKFKVPSNVYAYNTTQDTSSSISKDFTFKAQNSNNRVLTSTISNSSIYNSNPQLAKDFTIQDKLTSSTISQGTGYMKEGTVSLVNGPNTPVSSNRQIAPNYVPNVVTPTMNDVPSSKVPQLPYPRNSISDTPMNKSVFEHHPEVEGHKPFTELYDDETSANPELDSDADSDFTSVSQRAPNPRYFRQPSNNNYYPVPQNNQQATRPQGFQHQFQPQPIYNQTQPMNQQFTPNQQFMPSQQFTPNQIQPQIQPQIQQTQTSNHYYNPQPQYKSPTQNYFPPQQRGPTVSDNALSNNPDFALGGLSANKRKNPQFVPPSKRNLPNSQRPGGNGVGPYGMI